MTTENIPAEQEETTEVVEEAPQTTQAEEVKEEPVLRRSNAEHAKQRIEAKKEKQSSEEIDSLRAELQEIKSRLNESPEPQQAQPINESYVKDLEEIKIRTEVADYIADNPQFAKYKTKIIDLAKVSDLTYESLAYAAAGKELTKLGAQIEKDADNEANETKTSGSSSSQSMDKKEKPLEEMTDDEILSDILP